jgi:hypothetical protein
MFQSGRCASSSLTTGRVAIIPSRGWSGWFVAGEKGEEANVQVEVHAYTEADIKTFRV